MKEIQEVKGGCNGISLTSPITLTRLCDDCGFPHRPADPLRPWNWPGRPDGIWLHTRCEAAWYDQENGAR